ncbi:MAG: hypothetical protein A3D10_06295 [Omnitrophica WOR_2 bacterium RIFCSPHIGHO2_02_FULL_48_11]|nr:MAG: hypothetical protein A3D10_06295 [Omnitrophica WOR_2 bacterium RIFCSPHIGHO2_02_FULL_48_11]
MPKILDSHSHYLPPEVAQHTAFFKVNWSDIERHLTLMDQNGIERSVLLYPTSDAHIQMGGWQKLCDVYNLEISKIVKKYHDRFIGGGILPVDQPQNFKKELQRMEDLGLRILSLASSYEGKYLDDPIFDPVFEFAGRTGMPVHVHPQIMNPIGEERLRDPLLTPVLEYVFDVSACIGKMMMSGTFLKHPDVKFIFAHYGGVLPFVKERFDNTYQMLRKRNFVKDLTKDPSEYFKNLYFDISGSKSAASLMCALEVVDPGHILFGSDFPANQNLAAIIAVIDGAPLSAAEKSAIFANNFPQLLAL